MREIKFRGKRIDNNEWIHGWILTNKLGTYIITEENPHECTQYGYITIEQYHKVDPKTVGQFTGIHDDEYENELYEGDIIEMEYQERKIICGIQHCGSGFILASDDLEDGFIWISDVTENDIAFFWIPTAVKIGNVHDNPELIAA